MGEAAGRGRSLAVGEIAARVPGARLVGEPGVRVTGIVYDSRGVRTGDLFAALPGADVDGHRYAPEAVRRGAAALLTERELGLGVPELVVPASRAALAIAAAEFFGHPSRELGTIGVTGTDGKTTTSYLIDGVLRSAGLTTGMVGTVAVRIGDRLEAHATRQTTPESVDLQGYLRQMVEAGTGWAILEATSHGLAMHRLDGVAFRVGAVTNVTHEHLDYHGSLEAYRRAKGILFERVAASGGTAVINVDDPGAAAMERFAAGAAVVRYSAEGRAAELRATGFVAGARGTRFRLEAGDRGAADVALPLIGSFNVANALCAAGVALAAGVELDEVARGLGAAPAIPGRMERIDAGQPFSVVVDYAHTPDALEKVLGLLRGLHPGGKLIAVFGSAGERDVAKRPRQGVVAARLADFAVFTSEDPRNEDPEAIIAQIADGARAAGAREGVDFVRITERAEAVRHAIGMAGPGDCVLLAGKGHEGSIIWGREKRDWDEAGAARKALAELGYRGAVV